MACARSSRTAGWRRKGWRELATRRPRDCVPWRVPFQVSSLGMFLSGIVVSSAKTDCYPQVHLVALLLPPNPRAQMFFMSPSRLWRIA